MELCDFGGFPDKKEVPLVIADSALVKDFASLFNKGGLTSYKGGWKFSKGLQMPANQTFVAKEGTIRIQF